MAGSGKSLIASRRNLGRAREKQLEHLLQEEEFGSCRTCKLNDIDSPECKQCINGGGKFPLFSPKIK